MQFLASFIEWFRIYFCMAWQCNPAILSIPSKPYSFHSVHSAIGSRMNRMIFRSFRKRNRSQKNTNTVYSEYSYSGIVPKGRALNLPSGMSSSLSVLLRIRSAQRLSSQHFAAVPTPTIAEPVLNTHSSGACWIRDGCNQLVTKFNSVVIFWDRVLDFSPSFLQLSFLMLFNYCRLDQSFSYFLCVVRSFI